MVRRAATYYNVCKRVSNLYVQGHVTYVGLCIIYMLRTFNLCLTYKQQHALKMLCIYKLLGNIRRNDDVYMYQRIVACSLLV